VQIESEHVFEVQGGGTLTAEGTATDLITITAISGHFIGLRLWNGAHVSLAYCDVSNAGGEGWPPLDIQATDVTLDHCTLRDSGVGSGSAVKVSGSGLSPALTNTTIENNSGYAIYQSTIDMTPTYLNLFLDVVATGNTTKTVDIVLDSSDFPLDGGAIAVAPGELAGRWSFLTNLSQAGSTLILTAFPASIGGIPMSPGETARITVTIEAEIDERFVLHLSEQVDQEVVGGIQYVRELPDCVFLPLVMKGVSPVD
jgi:hypothetical protein